MKIPVDSPVRKIEAHKTIDRGVAITLVLDEGWTADVQAASAAAAKAIEEVAVLLSGALVASQ